MTTLTRRSLVAFVTLLSFSLIATQIYADSITIQVLGPTDDAEEHLTEGNTIDLTSSDLELGAEGGDTDTQLIGIRYDRFFVPQGGQIDSASIQFTVDETDDEDTSVRIYGELTPNSVTFTDTVMDITSRTRTTAFVDWNNIPVWDTVGAAGPDQLTPDLSSIVQEIVNQPAWEPGNAITFLFDANPGGERTAESANTSTRLAPMFNVSGPEVSEAPILPDPPADPGSFQNGFGGYRGTSDTEIRFSAPDADNSQTVGLNPDGADGGGPVHVLIKFEDIFGTEPDQIPLNGDIQSGTLSLNIFNPGTPLEVHRMAVDWVDTDATWNSFGGDGIQADGSEAFAAIDAMVTDPNDPAANVPVGVAVVDVTDSLRAWQADPSQNFGWALLPTGNDGIDFTSAEGTPIDLRPRLDFVALEAIGLNGSGQTYVEDFDSMGVGKNMPAGWRGETEDGGVVAKVDALGLVDGPLAGVFDSTEGIVNVGGNESRFTSTGGGRLATWQDDVDGSGLLGEGDVIADNATDRALGVAREFPDDAGKLNFSIEISNSPLRALTFDWDLEIWGGDPEGPFRGGEGPGMAASLSVGGTEYYAHTETLLPGDLFDTALDGSGISSDPTLINGNEHATRGISSGILEVSSADGAVGNTVNVVFDANHGGADEGWITAVDNVQIRALAAGDAQADGDVDPSDLIQLLAGAAFGKGNIDATWGQGDFDNDGDFDGFDILQIVQGLAGEFPKTYAHDPSNGVPDVLINPATGNITLDTNGTTIGSIVMDSAAGIFNGPNSPSWDAPGDFAADIDTQISMPISFTNPGYTGVDDLGDGIIGDLPPGFDILGDLTIKYLDPNGDLLDAEAHVVPEPSSIVLATFGVLGLLGYLWRRRRLS